MALKFHQNHPILAFLLALLFTQNISYTAFAGSGGRLSGGYSINPNRLSTRPGSRSGGCYYHGDGKMTNGNLDIWVLVLFGIILVICLLIGYFTRPRVLKI